MIIPNFRGILDSLPTYNQYLSVAFDTSFVVWRWSFLGGFGTAFSGGPSTAGTRWDCNFSPNSRYWAVSYNLTPFVSVSNWSDNGFGTQFSNPGTAVAGAGQSVTFSPNSDYIAISHSNSPFLTVYPWSASGFGTKVADPATLLPGQGRGVWFNSAGDTIAVAHATSPFASAYPFTSGSFGTKYANPGVLPSGTCNEVHFAPNGSDVAFASSSSPFIIVYPWSSGFGTKYSNPATLPGGSAYSVRFAPASNAIVTGNFNYVSTVVSGPRITGYPWTSGTGFGTRYSQPGDQNSTIGESYGMAFSSADDGLVVAIAGQLISGTTFNIQVRRLSISSGWSGIYAQSGSRPSNQNGNGASFGRLAVK